MKPAMISRPSRAVSPRAKSTIAELGMATANGTSASGNMLSARAIATIAMTAPVTQERAADDEATWTVRFIMPSKYALADLPQPAGSDVRLSEIPARRVAAIRFSGVATDELVGEKEAELMRWVAAQGLSAEGPPTYAYYNDPWTPGFLRRNEVMIGVE